MSDPGVRTDVAPEAVADTLGPGSPSKGPRVKRVHVELSVLYLIRQGGAVRKGRSVFEVPRSRITSRGNISTPLSLRLSNSLNGLQRVGRVWERSERLRSPVYLKIRTGKEM